MEAAEWFIFQKEKQEGPFSKKQVLASFNKNQIAPEAYLFKVGWKDWVAFTDCFDDLGISGNAAPAPTPLVPAATQPTDRRLTPPRASISGRIIVHDDLNLVIGTGVNISPSGIYVESDQANFKIGQKVKLTCKIEGITASFNVRAEVIHQNQGTSKEFGLAFRQIEDSVRDEIQKLIDAENANRGAAKQHG